MLKNLIKYEFKATGRILIPAYIGLIILAFLNKFVFSVNLIRRVFSSYAVIIQGLTMFAYVAAIVATVVITFLIIIQRFYKNLLGDQGYLMHTLPVQIWHNIAGKLIVAGVWTVASGLVAMLSIVVMVADFGSLISGLRSFFTSAAYALGEVYSQVGMNLLVYFVEGLIILILGIVTSITRIYAAISLGHLVSHKIIASFGAYIGLGCISYVFIIPFEIVISINRNFFDSIGQFLENHPIVGCHTILLGIVAGQLILAAIYCFVTNYILKNKLNLE